MKCLCKAELIKPPALLATDYKPLALARKQVEKAGWKLRRENMSFVREAKKGALIKKARFKPVYSVCPQWAFRVFR